MTKFFNLFYRIVHYSSIDVTLSVAMLAMPLAYQYCPTNNWIIILAFSVQIIYLSDHLLDVFYKNPKVLSPRHQFVKQYYKLFVILIIVLFLTNMYLCKQYLNTSAIIAGIGLCGLVIFYFFNHTSFNMISKEPLTAIIYAFGICMVPIYYCFQQPYLFHICLICMGIFICAFINLICNNLFEWSADSQNNEASFAMTIGKYKAELLLKILYFLSVTIYFFCLLYADIFTQNYVASLCGISFIHALLYQYKGSPYLNKYKRIILELSFGLPGVVYCLY